MTEKSAAELTANRASFDNGVQTAWDATSLDLAQTCMRKYYYANILGIKPKQKSVHLIFGGIYASALETFYKARAAGQAIDDALIEAVHLAMIESWQYKTCEDCNGRGLIVETHHCKACDGTGKIGFGPVLFEDSNKTRVALIRTIVWYIEQFGEEDQDGITTYHLQSGEAAVELSFRLDFATDILYCGHLDRVVEYGDDLYVMDQKTTKTTLSNYYFRGFDISNQMSGYTFAGKAVLHSPVSGVIIDAAQILVNSTHFDRGVTTRSKDQLEEWFESTVALIEQFQLMSERELFPMNPNSCGNYGGCPYRNLCAVSPKVRKNYIKSDFTSHSWDPIKPR